MHAGTRLATVGWHACGVGVLGGLQAGLLVWGSGAATATQVVSVLGAAALGGLALVWLAFDRRFDAMPVVWVVGLAVVWRVIAVQAEPLLEDDHYRYLWDGMRTAQHLDPYRLAPAAFFGNTDLPAPWQDILSGINHPDIPTVYGPVLQALFALAHGLAPGQVGAIQALVLVVDLACIALLLRLGVGARWLLVYALHPMILKEAMASAHPDGLVALWLLLAMLTWRSERRVCTGVLLGLAVATKVAALFVVPLFLFGPRRAGTLLRTTGAVGFGLVVALGAAYLPFLAAGGSDAVGLRAFALQWRFNPLLFRVIEAAVPNGLARPVAALLMACGLSAVAWHWRRAWCAGAPDVRDVPWPPVGAAVLLLLLLAPVVNAWYALWALGPAIVARGVLLPVMGGVGVLAYLHGGVLGEAGWLSAVLPLVPYGVPWPLAAVQLAALAVAAVVVHRSGARTAGVRSTSAVRNGRRAGTIR